MGPIIFSAVLAVCCGLSLFYLVANPNQTVMWLQKTDDGSLDLDRQLLWNFLGWFRKYILCWAFLVILSVLDTNFMSWEIVESRNL